MRMGSPERIDWMKKRIIAFCLMVALTLSLALPMQSFAFENGEGVEPATVQKAMNVVTGAVNEMGNVLGQESCSTLADIFNGFVAATRIASPIFGTINGSITFLKLLGIVKDSNAEALADIARQMQIISEEIAVMDEKLNQITTEMSKMQASAEFNARTEKAMLLQGYWKDFEYRYSENGMDTLIDEYNGMLRNGMRTWCTDVDSRTQTQLVLHYVLTDSGYAQVFETGAIDPADFSGEDRYLVLPQSLLPGAVAWNIDRYHDTLAEAITENLRNADSFVCGNFPAFSGEAERTDALLAQVADDAVNLLVYQVAAAQVNKDSTFSLQVQRQFSNYCSHLLAPEEGLDAVLKSFYLTHAFEYQIADDVKAFCNEMALKTGTYGAFAANILGMSDFVTEREKTAVLDTYCDSLIAIGDAKSNALTGSGQYCYLTSTVLSLDTVTLSTKVSVNTRTRGSASAYQTCSSSPISVTYGTVLGKDDGLIGDTAALLLYYTLRSNGVAVSFDYLNERLGSGALSDTGSVVTGLNGEQALPLNNNLKMKTYRVLGSYFKDGATVSLNSMPEDAESEYVVYRRMISGSLLDPAGGSISVNQVLTGTAIYGESHIYWEDDEAAILGGPVAQTSFSSGVNKRQVDVDFIGQRYFVTDYNQSVSYPCLVSKPVQNLSAGGQYDPLASFKALNDELASRFTVKLLGVTPTVTPTAPECRFTDVAETDWYYDCVTWAYANDITGGTDDTHFSPYEICTRAQTITFLWRAAGCPTAEAALAFTDLADYAYYLEAVRWAAVLSVTNGTSESTFSPNEEITREQLATLLFCFAKMRGETTDERADLSAFSDSAAVSTWAKEAMSWCVAQGIITGTDGNRLAPGDAASRAECMAMLCRFFVGLSRE